MKIRMVRCLVIGAVLIASSGLAEALRPSLRLADAGSRVELEELIPSKFGEWRIDPSVVPLSVSPDVQQRLDYIYDQTLSRTYINNRGTRVMLSIAYGGRQTRTTQVHKPEVCYPAQGFQITRMAKEALHTTSGQIPVMRLVAVHGSRVEPITYWIMVGDHAVRGAVEQNLARVRYGLAGTVPDGMLVRVSTISNDIDIAYQTEDQFVEELLRAVPESSRARLAGASSG